MGKLFIGILWKYVYELMGFLIKVNREKNWWGSIYRKWNWDIFWLLFGVLVTPGNFKEAHVWMY